MGPQWFLLAFSPVLVRPPCSIVRYNNSATIRRQRCQKGLRKIVGHGQAESQPNDGLLRVVQGYRRAGFQYSVTQKLGKKQELTDLFIENLMLIQQTLSEGTT